MEATILWLNSNSGAVQAVATVILVIITGFYALYTYRMAAFMSKQVVSDIAVSDAVIGTPLVEDWFRKRLAEKPNEWKDWTFEFRLLFDIRNRSSASGSIDKPTLVIGATNAGKSVSLPPRTKHHDYIRESPTTTRIDETDLGGTFYLAGGDSKKVELEYWFHPDEEAARLLLGNLDNLQYAIKFSDNLGRETVIAVSDIRPKDRASRV